MDLSKRKHSNYSTAKKKNFFFSPGGGDYPLSYKVFLYIHIKLRGKLPKGSYLMPGAGTPATCPGPGLYKHSYHFLILILLLNFKHPGPFLRNNK